MKKKLSLKSTPSVDNGIQTTPSYQPSRDNDETSNQHQWRQQSITLDMGSTDNCKILNQTNNNNNRSNLYGSFDGSANCGIGKQKLGNELAVYGSYEDYRRKSSMIRRVCVADVIGSFGWFQLIVLLFSGLREAAVGYDAVITSVLLQPEEQFTCNDPLPTSGYSYASSSGQFQNETYQCFLNLDGRVLLDSESGKPMKCHSWTFPERTVGASLTSEWGLVCHRHWLAAFIESAYFLGLVLGNLCWGSMADKFGRRRAYLMSHTIATIFGNLSIFAPNIWLFSVCRFGSAFGSIGYNIIYSIQVELIGTKHRAFSTILNHLGWGFGVIMVPVVNHMFDTHTPIIALAPIISLIMFPWAICLPESSRWLMANERYDDARRELKRAARFNGKPIDEECDKLISQLEQKCRYDKMVQETLNRQRLDAGDNRKSVGIRRVLAENPILLRDTIILGYTAFAGHLFYYLLTINFGYVKNLSVDANFIISGAGEWFSVAIGAVLLRFCTRKTCMFLFLTLMTCSFIFQCILELDIAPGLDNSTITTLNNAIGTLSALLLIFVVLIVNQEVFPTVVRQTGSSLVNTIGELGSTLAPLVIQIGLSLGAWQSNLLFASVCFTTLIGTRYISRTDDIDLPDT